MFPTNPEQGGMWAILGGTFDPVHNGHLTLGYEILSMKMLDGLLLVPAYHPPHKPKNCFASYEDRVAMLQLAIESYDYYHISRIEEELAGTGFTLHTVRALKKKYPAAGFYFLIGADNIEAIKDWYRPEEIIDEIKIIAGTRPGFKPERATHQLADKIEYITTTPVDISSSDIRRKIKEGASRGELVRLMPEKVTDYILENNLYR
jgi:nicotinate-nucleotide adenylyltransferase